MGIIFLVLFQFKNLVFRVYIRSYNDARNLLN